MGDRVTLGHYVYTIFDVQWMTQLGVGPSARIPSSRFLLVRFRTLNSGAVETMVPAMTLEDDSGHVYEELSDGDQVPQWVGFIRPVAPAASVQGNIVFDVPPAHYKLRIKDETEQRAALIDLPLTFSREAPPDLPATLPKQ
ncbi:MAG TPA: DUF4352 domain-containing protein [Bryobacteraceae bacterium]|nr:DUF4352 domain-containing protein [Bryobacteraceae bacterium]